MSNDQTTKPTLETVLERINTVGETLTSRMNEIANDVAQLRTDVEKRFSAVDREIANLRRDVERGFRGVERKIGYLNNDLLERRTVVEDLELRIEELENKAS